MAQGRGAVFAELERGMIQERVKAGLARARAETPEQRREKGKKAIGRPRLSKEQEAAIAAALATGAGVHKVARWVGVGSGSVVRVRDDIRKATVLNGAA